MFLSFLGFPYSSIHKMTAEGGFPTKNVYIGAASGLRELHLLPTAPTRTACSEMCAAKRQKAGPSWRSEGTAVRRSHARRYFIGLWMLHQRKLLEYKSCASMLPSDRLNLTMLLHSAPRDRDDKGHKKRSHEQTWIQEPVDPLVVLLWRAFLEMPWTRKRMRLPGAQRLAVGEAPQESVEDETLLSLPYL